MFGWGKKKSESNLLAGAGMTPGTSGNGSAISQKVTKCFGVPFALLPKDENEIPLLIKKCIEYLEQDAALRQEGICSVTPSIAEVQRVQNLFEESSDHYKVNLSGCDFGAVAGMLKRFFRELPAPIYTNELYQNFVAAQSLSDPSELLQEIANLFVHLPTPNQMILYLLLRWLHKLVQYAPVNGLSSTHLGFLWQPNLIFDSSPGAAQSDSLHIAADGQHLGLVVAMMIDYYPNFFSEFDAHFASIEASNSNAAASNADAASAAEQAQREQEQLQQQMWAQQQQQQQEQEAQLAAQQQQAQQMQWEQQQQQQQLWAQQQQQQQQQAAYQQNYYDNQQYQQQQQQYQEQQQPAPVEQTQITPRAVNPMQQAQRLQFGAIANEALLKRGQQQQQSQGTAQQQPVSPRNKPAVPVLPTGAVPLATGSVSPHMSSAISPRPMIPTNVPVVQQPRPTQQPSTAPTAAPPKLNVVIPPTNVQLSQPGAKQASTNMVVPQTPNSSVSPRIPPAQALPSIPQTPQRVPVIVNGYTKGTVLSDWFAAEMEGTLPLAKDDVIYITKKHADGWWEGYKFGQRGFFPSTFVAEIYQQ